MLSLKYIRIRSNQTNLIWLLYVLHIYKSGFHYIKNIQQLLTNVMHMGRYNKRITYYVSSPSVWLTRKFILVVSLEKCLPV